MSIFQSEVSGYDITLLCQVGLPLLCCHSYPLSFTKQLLYLVFNVLIHLWTVDCHWKKGSYVVCVVVMMMMMMALAFWCVWSNKLATLKLEGLVAPLSSLH